MSWFIQIQTYKTLLDMNQSGKNGVVEFESGGQTCQILLKRLYYSKKENGYLVFVGKLTADTEVANTSIYCH